MEEWLNRIAQKALNNAFKHAAANSVEIRLTAHGRGAAMEVADDGRGFDPGAAGVGGGLGLTNMCERAESLGGILLLRSVPGAGTTVRVEVGPARVIAGGPGRRIETAASAEAA